MSKIRNTSLGRVISAYSVCAYVHGKLGFSVYTSAPSPAEETLTTDITCCSWRDKLINPPFTFAPMHCKYKYSRHFAFCQYLFIVS